MMGEGLGGWEGIRRWTQMKDERQKGGWGLVVWVVEQGN